MDNELRIKRVKEGIEMLENGVDPVEKWIDLYDWVIPSEELIDHIGLSQKGKDILYINTVWEEGIKNGFKEGGIFDTKIMLHNWKRFLELIEKL